jgi:archaellum component FlaC
MLETWQAIFLILLCFTSLIIALYCLFFMVPLKSFMNRINSLGGGMEGMRAHLQGIRNKIEKQISAMESDISRKREDDREEFIAGITDLRHATARLEQKLQESERTANSLQANIKDSTVRTRNLASEVKAIREDLNELQNDFAVFREELNGSLRQMVSNSYMELEATVLSSLEAIQEEILWTCSKDEHASNRRPNGDRPRSRPSLNDITRALHKETHKIISAQPLFPDNSAKTSSPRHDERPTGESETPEDSKKN